MTHCAEDSRIHRKGSQILTALNELVLTIRDLESNFEDNRLIALRHCEDVLMSVMIDVASVCTSGAPWPVLRQMLLEAGVSVPEDLDRDLTLLQE